MGRFTSDRWRPFYESLSERYKERQPYESESQWFADNPDVSGMASEDGAVVLNPHLNMSPGGAVRTKRNESVRLLMDDVGYSAKSGLTDDQKALSSGMGAYGSDEDALKKTILARILADDESLGPYTPDQVLEAELFADAHTNWVKKP